jgi:uncharacterized protein with NAD-binding domain and iron-sulfur cluster
MREAGGKVKVAILGGGMAGLTAAFELSRTPELRERYEVTVHQMGWRLGGKCATGRGDHGRIEEHGIHGFSGSYYNAFGLMHACYEALPDASRVGDAKSVGVLKSFEEAFQGVDRVLLWQVTGGKLRKWPFYIAPNRMKPADYHRSMADIQRLIEAAVRIAGPPDAAERTGRLTRLWRRLCALWAAIPLLYRTGLLESMARTALGWFDPRYSNGAFLHRVRRLRLFANFFLSMRRGVNDPKDDILNNGFDHIDDRDYQQWLKDHGAIPDTLNSALSYNTIDLSYSYPGGDTTRPPRMGAGTYLHWTLRMFLCLGSFIWAFAAGTGETIVVPLYLVLKHRQVKFKFFHKITDLRLSDDGMTIASVDIDRQATLKDESAEYDPLILLDTPNVNAMRCWPSKPKYELLSEGHQIAEKDIDLESYWSQWNADASRRRISLKAGVDYDQLIFAISVDAAKYVCQEILNLDGGVGRKWTYMTDFVITTPTQTMQIWLRPDAAALASIKGREGGRGLTPPVLSGTFVQPFNGGVDVSNLIKYESWPSGSPPLSLWYFTGAMSDEPNSDLADHGYPARQRDRVRHQAIQFLQAAAGYLLPATKASWSPMALDFSNLYTVKPGADGVARFEDQFWRANIDPTERYVLAPAGSTRHRLEAHQSGFDNLVLAGDWIYNGLNVGSFEGAVMGGRLAANAISGSPDLASIHGYPWWRRAPRPSPEHRS